MKVGNIEFTGERVYPENYHWRRPLLYYHLARYAYAKSLLRRGDRVVDIACGTGYGTYELASVADSVIGIDISSDSIEYANKMFSTGNIQFIIGNATNLSSLVTEVVDAVVSFETLEHLTDRDQDVFLSGVKRILAPSGMLIISTPNTLVYSRGEKTTNPYHPCELTPQQFRDKLQSSFSVVQLFGQRKFEGSTAKGLVLLMANIVLQCARMKFTKIRLNGDVAQQVGDFEFTSYGIESCQYLVAVCKRPK